MSSSKVYTPEEIVDILQSIERVEVVGDELEIYLKGDTTGASVYTGFVPGSFTRELMELIYHHMTPEDEFSER